MQIGTNHLISTLGFASFFRVAFEYSPIIGIDFVFCFLGIFFIFSYFSSILFFACDWKLIVLNSGRVLFYRITEGRLDIMMILLAVSVEFGCLNCFDVDPNPRV